MRVATLTIIVGAAAAACGETVVLGDRHGDFTPPPPNGLWSVLEAESFTARTASAVAQMNGESSGGAHLTSVTSGETLTFPPVDLGAGAVAAQVRLATPRRGGVIELRLDAPDGPLLASGAIPATGGWAQHHSLAWSSKWRVVTLAAMQELRGSHALVLVLRHPEGGRVADLDLLRLLGAHTPRTYVVARGGSDRGLGTASSPLASVGEAAFRARPGDPVVVRGGTYYERLAMAGSASGTPDQRITFEAAPGEEPILDGEGMQIWQYAALLESRADHVTYRGLTVRNADWLNGRGVFGDGDFVRIERLRVHTTQESGISCNDCVDARIVGNEIWDTSRMNFPRRAEGFSTAIGLFQSEDAAVEGNVIHDNHGDGIKVWKDIHRVRIAGNVVRDGWSTGIYLDNAHDSVVEGNLVYTTAERYVPWEAPEGRALITAFGVGDHGYWTELWKEWRCDNPPVFTPGARNTFRNNIAVNTRTAFAFGLQDMPCSGLKDTLVVNNTFVGQWDDAIFVNRTRRPTDHAGTTFRNNVLQTRGSGRSWQTVVGIANRNDTRFEHNLLFRGPAQSPPIVFTEGPIEGARALTFTEFAGTNGNTGNVWGDPLLTGAIGSALGVAGAGPKDVAQSQRLGPGSPAIDQGTREGAPDRDYFGGARPAGGGVDIGAHEAR
jgi:hypothetical protein